MKFIKKIFLFSFIFLFLISSFIQCITAFKIFNRCDDDIFVYITFLRFDKVLKQYIENFEYIDIRGVVNRGSGKLLVNIADGEVDGCIISIQITHPKINIIDFNILNVQNFIKYFEGYNTKYSFQIPKLTLQVIDAEDRLICDLDYQPIFFVGIPEISKKQVKRFSNYAINR